MLDSRQIFHPQAWTIAQAHRFLTSVPHMEQAGLVVRVPDWWQVRQTSRPEVRVRIGQHGAGHVGMDSLMDFSIDLALDGEPLTDAERAQILRATDGLALLRGRWVEVDHEKLQQALEHWRALEQQYADGVDFIQGMRMLAGVRLGKDEDDEETAGWTRVTAGDWLADTLRQLRDPSGIVDCEPGRDLNATLLPYQVDGVRWLWFMTRLGLGACLADDMGLGKTIQVIDLLLLLKREDNGRSPGRHNGRGKPPAPNLLIVPASLVGNWKSEFERLGNGINFVNGGRRRAHRLREPAEFGLRQGGPPVDLSVTALPSEPTATSRRITRRNNRLRLPCPATVRSIKRGGRTRKKPSARLRQATKHRSNQPPHP
jgi:non-specific serine/threonine protein kinase